MQPTLRLTNGNWRCGSYCRADYKTDVIYTLFQYKEFSAAYNFSTGGLDVADGCLQQLQQHALVSRGAAQAYLAGVQALFARAPQYDTLPIEALYGQICALRRQFLGVDALQNLQRALMAAPCAFNAAGGVDQTDKKLALLRGSAAGLFVLGSAQLCSLMQQDIQTALAAGMQVYVAANTLPGADIPTQDILQARLGCEGLHYLPLLPCDEGAAFASFAADTALQGCIDNGSAALFVYGEEGLLQCKDLLADALVQAVPQSYHAKALVNGLGQSGACAVYVPRGFNILPYVPVIRRTQLSYRTLALLHRAYGEAVYACTPQQLQQRYPHYFLNVYDAVPPPPHMPIHMPPAGDAGFDALREQALGDYLNTLPGLTYRSAWFDDALTRQPIPWAAQQAQNGILVHAVKIAGPAGAQIINSRGSNPLRQTLQAANVGGPALVSNFLFFFTPKLAALYNALRADRPQEQMAFVREHMDYMLQQRGGQRVESFPLFRKACMAKLRDGRFVFCNFRLGGGEVTLAGQRISWAAQQVDIPGAHSEPVCVYTPYFSQNALQADRAAYRTEVGAGRLNIVMVQQRIICIRRGDVVLPSVGVVLSLGAAQGEAFVRAAGLTADARGYYACEGLPFTVKLHGPQDIPAQTWQQVEWAYGGGLTLMVNGRALCDAPSPEQWFAGEGWLSPLSRQTQESALHTMVRHPRTAIGTTRRGELVILVYSGRSYLSHGADYAEMCRIARQMFPDIHCLMNADGGASAVLGAVVGGRFIELSLPSVSYENCVGQARPVNTALCVALRAAGEDA